MNYYATKGIRVGVDVNIDATKGVRDRICGMNYYATNGIRVGVNVNIDATKGIRVGVACLFPNPYFSKTPLVAGKSHHFLSLIPLFSKKVDNKEIRYRNMRTNGLPME
jgi:hypothetical protein